MPDNVITLSGIPDEAFLPSKEIKDGEINYMFTRAELGAKASAKYETCLRFGGPTRTYARVPSPKHAHALETETRSKISVSADTHKVK
ncbi:hypothetical protein EVAR_69952_1 [Eumeta japonica]|uniref:Uncharacterized protein n=1 Tax=Eumeta variegata TaxID=151549 RepID=A0A4C1SP54_EUMVA|nr:hypothetical protein EVAR_69952_1 [Eumeta japonica]